MCVYTNTHTHISNMEAATECYIINLDLPTLLKFSSSGIFKTDEIQGRYSTVLAIQMSVSETTIFSSNIIVIKSTVTHWFLFDI